jgi:hypothetical protein
MRALLIALLIAGPSVAGCFGGDTSYADRANAICARSVGFARGLARPPAGTPAADRAFRRLVRARRRALADLKALDPPPDDRATVARMLGDFEESQRLLERAVRLGESESVLPTLLAAAQVGRRGHVVARRLGLGDCAGL